MGSPVPRLLPTASPCLTLGHVLSSLCPRGVPISAWAMGIPMPLIPRGSPGRGTPQAAHTARAKHPPHFPRSQRAAPMFSRRLLLLNCANEMTLIKAITPQPGDGCCRLSRAPQPQPCPAPGRTRVPALGTQHRSQPRGTRCDPVFADKRSVPGPGAGMAPAQGPWHRPPNAASPGAVTPTGDGDRDGDGFGVAAVQRRTTARPLLLCQLGTRHSASPLPGLSSVWGTPAPTPGWQWVTRASAGRGAGCCCPCAAPGPRHAQWGRLRCGVSWHNRLHVTVCHVLVLSLSWGPAGPHSPSVASVDGSSW